MIAKFLHALSRWHIIVVATLLLLIYYPGLNGPFVLDDGENITLNKAIHLTKLDFDSLYGALWANESGLLRRPLASLSFALNYYFAGGAADAYYFKLTNLVIHGANSALVYILLRLLLSVPTAVPLMRHASPRTVAFVAAAIWSVHPIQLTSVLYVVQRMNSLAAFFVLAGLIIFASGRRRYIHRQPHGMSLMAAGIIIGTVLGLTSKENAVLTPLLALVIEYTIFSRLRSEPDRAAGLRVFYSSLLIIPSIALVTYLLIYPEIVTHGYLTRHFSAWERLLTESRVLWFYLATILVPNTQQLGLFHDDIEISMGLLNPVTTLAACVGILGLLAFASIWRSRYPLLAFSILWFLAGHSLESTVFDLEIAYEHRNYLPSIGPIVAGTALCLSLLKRARLPQLLKLILPYALVLLFSATTWVRAQTWSDLTVLSETEVRNHPRSPRANDFAARVSISQNNDIRRAINYTLAASKLQPTEAGTYIDVQILLSALEQDINANFHPEGLTAKSTILKIEGLDPEINTVVNGGRVHLRYPSGSPEYVEQLLAQEPISVHTIFSLELLRKCVLDSPRPCHDLRDLTMRWHSAAAANPRIPSDFHGIVFHNLALLSADRAEYLAAYNYLLQASEKAPERIAYQIGQVEYLIRLGKLPEAEQRLEQVIRSARPADVIAHGPSIERLRNLLGKAPHTR